MDMDRGTPEGIQHSQSTSNKQTDPGTSQTGQAIQIVLPSAYQLEGAKAPINSYNPENICGCRSS